MYPEGDALSTYYPATETFSQDIPWNALPELIATVLMNDFADLGIGNAPGANTDWTFSGNAKSYSSKRLRVYVRETK